MACGEDEPQQVIADIVFTRCIERVDEIRHDVGLECIHLAPEFFMLARVQRFLTQPVERAIFRCRHQPGSRVGRHARVGPVFERGDERVLRELFGEAHVAHDPRDVGDDSRGFDPPDRLDGPMGVGLSHGRPQGAPSAFGSMCTSSQMWPSTSSKPWLYMKP